MPGLGTIRAGATWGKIGASAALGPGVKDSQKDNLDSEVLGVAGGQAANHGYEAGQEN